MTSIAYEIIDFGVADYLSIQDQVKQKISRVDFTPSIFIGEHFPVITMGRSQTAINNILTSDTAIPIIQTERGGDVTYHGPGQLIVYPIVELVGQQRDLHQYLRILEELIIRSLKDCHIDAHRKDSLTGVWVQDKKVASIGVAVKNIHGCWRTYHGLALNICCDLNAFSLLNPCGLEASIMANIVDFIDTEPQHLQDYLKQRLLFYTGRYIYGEF